MLRTLLLAVVLAVFPLYSVAFAADLPTALAPTPDELAIKVIAAAYKNKWAINIDQVQRTIDAGVNFGPNRIVIPIGCDATDCQDAIAVNTETGKIIRLPTAAYGYDFRAGNNLLIVNPHARADYLRVSDDAGTGKVPERLFRELYTIEDGKFAMFYRDKDMPDEIPNESMFQTFAPYVQ